MGRVKQIVIVGAGPAGLIAADHLSSLGLSVTILDQMPSPARKFLMAGRGGLNLTHSEERTTFLKRYGDADTAITRAVEAFPPPALIRWCEGLGQPTFVGSSGRVFPRSFKASPLLRALLQRLEERGVQLERRSRLAGIGKDGTLHVHNEGVDREITPDATLLALGGSTWPRLGADGAWVGLLEERGIVATPLRPFNAGVMIPWSAIMQEKFAGIPLKPLIMRVNGTSFRGEAVVTRSGLEGGIIYAAGAELAKALTGDAPAAIALDLAPDLTLAALSQRLSKQRKGQSQSTRLARAGLKPVAVALLREAGSLPVAAADLAVRIKALPFSVTGYASPERAISSSGGVALPQLTADFMVRDRPGLFLAGEMLDWQAPTGGYLLQACFATGMAAARGIAIYLNVAQPDPDPVTAEW